MVSAIHQHESAIGTHMSSPSNSFKRREKVGRSPDHLAVRQKLTQCCKINSTLIKSRRKKTGRSLWPVTLDGEGPGGKVGAARGTES